MPARGRPPTGVVCLNAPSHSFIATGSFVDHGKYYWSTLIPMTQADESHLCPQGLIMHHEQKSALEGAALESKEV